MREARAEERRTAAAAAEAGGDPGDVSHQPLLNVGNRLVSHLMSVSSCPEGKTAVLRANVVLVAGLVGLFGDVVVELEQEGDDGGGSVWVEGHRTGRFVLALVVYFGVSCCLRPRRTSGQSLRCFGHGSDPCCHRLA